MVIFSFVRRTFNFRFTLFSTLLRFCFAWQFRWHFCDESSRTGFVVRKMNEDVRSVVLHYTQFHVLIDRFLLICVANEPPWVRRDYQYLWERSPGLYVWLVVSPIQVLRARREVAVKMPHSEVQGYWPHRRRLGDFQKNRSPTHWIAGDKHRHSPNRFWITMTIELSQSPFQ